MRGLVLLGMVLATPVYAHHEIVVTSLLMQSMGGLAVIGVAIVPGLREWLREKSRGRNVQKPLER